LGNFGGVNTNNISTETFNYNTNTELNNDLLILGKEGIENQFDRTTIINVTDNNGSVKTVRIDWCNLSSYNSEFTTLLIPETGKLFFGTRFMWGIINLENLEVERQEHSAETFWMFERHLDTIVVIEELSAKSLSLNGTQIHKVPIDPPFESEDFENRIEFDSPVYGKQTLKLK
jgi:hypothetical protein